MNKNVLICDANHGGLILLDEYSKYTSNNLFFYDTYNKLDERKRNYYSQKYNVSFIDKDDVDESFTSIAPVHMKKLFPIDYTHHEFSSYLISKHKKRYGWDFKFIQVTGVKGKTTTVMLIRELLQDYRLIVLSSNNLSYHSKEEDKILDDSLSITPASIVKALNIAKKHDLLDKVDFFISEVSLGVVPNGYISILTNILENYPIANNSSNASLAKMNVFNSDIVLCQKKAYDDYYKDNNAFTVSVDDDSADYYLDEISYDFYNTKFSFCHLDTKIRFNCFAPSDFYLNNVLFSTCVADIIGIDPKRIQEYLKNISLIKGRSSYKKIRDKILIEEINPGLNTTSIKDCINNLKRYYDNFLIIIGGDYGITCEEIDEDKLLDYIKTIKDKKIIFTGKLGYSLYDKLDNKSYVFIKDLNDAIAYSLENESDRIIEVIYRSEYGRHVNID